jgi:hypothetical protein
MAIGNWAGMNTRGLLLTLLLFGPSAQAKDVTIQVNGHSVRLDIASADPRPAAFSRFRL